MTTQLVPDLGQLGAVGGAAPFTITARVAGAAVDLTGYTGLRFEAWDHRARAALTAPAAAALATPADGTVTITPAATFYAASGTYEGRLWGTPPSGSEHPFDAVRWSIGDNPAP